MCILDFDFDSFLIKTKNKIKQVQKRIKNFFSFLPCIQSGKRKDSNEGIFFENPLYDPNYELKEVVVIPNNIYEQKYYEIDDDNIILQNNDLLSSNTSNSTEYDEPVFLNEVNNYIEMDGESVFENDIEYEDQLYTNNEINTDNEISDTESEHIYENVEPVRKIHIRKIHKVEENENKLIRDIVFDKLNRDKLTNDSKSYNKSLSDIPEYSDPDYSYSDDFEEESLSNNTTFSDNSISEDSISENIPNNSISKSEISIRSVDINDNSSSEDNWDVLSN